MGVLRPPHDRHDGPLQLNYNYKIDQTIDGFGNRFLKDFGKDFGTKIEVEIHVIFERRFFEKTSFSHRKIYVFDINGVQVGSKNRSKIYQNLKSKMGSLLTSIVDTFLKLLGSKLGGQIEPRSIKNRSKKASKKKAEKNWCQD